MLQRGGLVSNAQHPTSHDRRHVSVVRSIYVCYAKIEYVRILKKNGIHVIRIFQHWFPRTSIGYNKERNTSSLLLTRYFWRLYLGAFAALLFMRNLSIYFYASFTNF